MGVTPQNVTITSNTYKIIKNDVLLFQNKNNKLTFNGILNRIIKNITENLLQIFLIQATE